MPERTINFLKQVTFQTIKNITIDDDVAVSSLQSIYNRAINSGDSITDAEMPTLQLGVTIDWSAGSANDLIVEFAKGYYSVEQNLTVVTNSSPIFTNAPPAIYFYDQQDEIVLGAGNSDVNGTYTQNGTLNGKPYYEQDGGTYKIFWDTFLDSPAGSDQDYWVIHDVDTITDANLAQYGVNSSASTPPSSIWDDIAGDVGNTQVSANSLASVLVSGAGNQLLNGIYYANGLLNGYPRYDQVGGSGILARDAFGSDYWFITDGATAPVDLSETEYAIEITSSQPVIYPITGTWLATPTTGGVAPAPNVYTLPISTNTGNLYEDEATTISVVYNYVDPDGDPEGSHLYQWYEADDTSKTNPAAISGATSSTFELTPSELGKYLYVKITPKDDQDLTGTEIESETTLSAVQSGGVLPP